MAKIGNFGITTAYLYIDNKCIGYTTDTPNAVAHALSKNDKINKVIGFLGEYDMEDIKKRVWFAKDEENLGKNLTFKDL